MSNRIPRSRARGFTLIELMVVVTIIGILSAIAFPAYGAYLVRGNRAAAQAYLLSLAQAQAQYFADAHSYAATTSALNMPVPDQVATNYSITIDVPDAVPPSFTVTARPTGSRQTGDSVLTIDNSGARTPSSLW